MRCIKGGIMKKNVKCSKIFILFFLLLLYPLAGGMTDAYFPLNGVVLEKEEPEFSVKKLCDGTYQNDVDAYLLNHVNGWNLAVKAYNQLLYSIFHVSSNDNVEIGLDNQLFEPEYLYYSLGIFPQPSNEEIQNLIGKLVALDKLLQENNKQLYLFITPSKARYYEEKAPAAYKFCSNVKEDGLAYDKFIQGLDHTNLKVFDSIQYINQNRQYFDFPLWYATGIHWSRALGSEVAVGFHKYLKESSGYDLGQIQVEQMKAPEPLNPDADLYNTLNLLVKPKEIYYTQKFCMKDGDRKPNVFFRGGSFMGQSLKCLVDNHILGRTVYFENYYYTLDGNKMEALSDFDSYDEMDIPAYIEQSDILVLEVNENKIWIMSWGFIDYILDYYGVAEGE